MNGMEWVFINGEPSSAVNALDRGLHYGDGVFRTLKVGEGRVHWWEDQYRKLVEDCAALKIPSPDRRALEADVQRLAREPGVGVVKIIVTRGSGQRGYGIPADITPGRIVIGYAPSGRENLDVRVRWCNLRLASQPILAGIKHLNRLEHVLARSEWDDPGIAEGLLRDEAGHVICGSMTNLFIAEQGRLITPDLSRCGIAGVARARIMRNAERRSIPVSSEAISAQRLLASDAVLLCNSLIGLWRVAELEDRHWPDGGWAEILRNCLHEDD